MNKHVWRKDEGLLAPVPKSAIQSEIFQQRAFYIDTEITEG